MGFWNKMFPYSNVHELNLDWLISKMKELSLSVTSIAERLTHGLVRTDENQQLDDQEKLTARTNIDAAPNTCVRYDATQVLSSEQKTTALANISAVDKRLTLDGFVRYDMAQPMGDEAQRRARANIGATSLDITSINYVSFASEQNLSEAQKARARNNIGAGTGGGSADGAVRYDEAQNLETAQKYQARQNIDATSTNYVNDNFVAAYQRQQLTPTFKANARGNIAAVSYEAQTLTTEQQAQARANIGVNGGGSLDGAVRYDAAQDLTEDQKAQARNNIGAGTGSGSGGNQVYVGDDEPKDANVLEWIDTSEDVSGYNLQELLLLAHPVGSIYQSTQSTSPATLFGGTWEALEDVFLLAAGSGHAAGSTGGEESHVLTVAELAAHGHNIARSGSVTEAEVSLGGPGQYSSNNFASLGISGIDALATTTFSITDTGEGQAHNNMPPYQAVYTWKRTA